MHAHRPTVRGARQQRRIQCDVVGAVMAVAARPLDMLDDDAVGRRRQRDREVGSEIVDALAVRPDMDAVRVHCAMAQDGAIDAWARNGLV